MTRIRVQTMIDAPPKDVWRAIEDISRHVDWMDDAKAIRFTSPTQSGVGVTYECDTKIGPLRLTDEMEITEWSPGKAMGVRHVGLVTGEGRFTLTRARGGRTRFTWKERLIFPLWMGGPLGGVVGGQILKHVWRHNLSNLKEQLAQQPARPRSRRGRSPRRER
jgi:uncharacterized protein YndB with AHSA1/START domain